VGGIGPLRARLVERLGIHPAVFPDGAPPCRDLLASFRARDPDWARAASRRHLDEQHAADAAVPRPGQLTGSRPVEAARLSRARTAP